MYESQTVFVVDDDAGELAAIMAKVKSMGLEAVPFPSGEEFFNSEKVSWKGCVVAGISMAGMSGLQLQQQLAKTRSTLPVIMTSGIADIPTTVRALKQGAVTVLEKPLCDQELLDAIQEGFARADEFHRRAMRQEELQSLLASLNTSEKLVLDAVIDGARSPAIARRLGKSVRNVEFRQKLIYKKLGVGSIAQLVRLVMEAEALEAASKANWYSN